MYQVAKFCTLLFLFYISCQPVPKRVRNVMENSTRNEKELMKVISHYSGPANSGKRSSAYFLIQNLPSHTHYKGPGVANYKKAFSKLIDTPEEQKEDLKILWDSLKACYGAKFPGLHYAVDDVEVLSSAYLINHIDAAFKAWNYPWAKNLKFEEFCEYILPYKLVSEEPSLWIEDIQHRYKWLTDSVPNGSDLFDVSLMVNNELKKRFKIRSAPFIWDVTYEELDEIKSGKCFHATQYTTYTMRALGIPVVMDFTPFWGNMNGGHEWNALIYNNKPIPFVGSESDPGKTKLDLAFRRKRGKIYRRVFSLQSDILALSEGDEDIPKFFTNFHLKDVTREYIPVSSMTLQISKSSNFFKFVYLCVFNKQKWQPLAIGAVEDSVAIFQDMGRGIVYMPMYYREGKYTAATYPVLLKSDGRYEYIRCNGKRSITINILKKGPAGPSIQLGREYELYYWDNKWISLGKKIAHGTSISFENCPSGALYWVRSSEKTANERIFTIKNGKQIWW